MRLPSRVYCLTTIINICVLLVVFAGVSPLSAQQKVTIAGTPNALQDGSAQLVGHYNPQQMLRLVLALQPPHMADEEEFLRQLRDPNSPQFHKFLSENEWDARFAPAEQDEQAVVSWAQNQGLTITARYPNRLLVDLEAPVATIEKAFNVAINEYQVRTESHFSNDRDPSIPASLANVIHAVLGLNNIEVAHAFSRIKNLEQRESYPVYSPGPTYAVGSHLEGSGSLEKLNAANDRKRTDPFYNGYGLEPTDLYSSTGYDYDALRSLGHCCNPLGNPNNSPPESSIAITIWDDFADSDYGAFLTQYSYLAHNVQRYSVDGTPRCCSPETTLDLDWATAMSNSFDSPADTAEIHVYEGTNNQWSTLLDVVNRVLTDGNARVLSMSWGGAENYNADRPTRDSFHTVFNQLTGQGWSLIAASGDWGSTGDCQHISVVYPASDPNVTATGGTALGGTENAWTGDTYYGACRENDGGSSGGCSVYDAPDYQQGLPGCNAGRRIVPDVALNAGVFQVLYYQGRWLPVGGTSIVAPEIAGFVAQENAYLLYLQSVVGNTCGPSLSAPCAPMGAANPYIYAEGRYQPAPHYPFYDITSGCADNDITFHGQLPYYCALAGFDQTTGWGSINMLQLAWTINDFLAGDGAGPTASLSGPQTNFWSTTGSATVSWTLTDTSGNGHVATGVLGASAAWDSDPGDPLSEPGPGENYLWSWNPFYGGPQYLGAAGSLDLNWYHDGCHSFHLRAVDNTGRGSGDLQYGPVCFDVLPPATSSTLDGTSQDQGYVGPVRITFTATDNYGSGVAYTTYQIDGGAWQDYVPPLYVVVPGSHTVTYYSADNVGNLGYYRHQQFTISSNSQFNLSVSKAGSGSGTVTSDVSGINCGSTCSATYYDQQPVSLTATPVLGSMLTGWQGCDLVVDAKCFLNVHSDRSVTVVFNPRVAARFVPVTPCRVVDTRWSSGPFGGPAIQGGTSRDFAIPNGPCSGIPANAAAYSLNVTVVPHGVLGYLTVFPAGYNRPLISTINSYDGRNKANAAIVPAGNSSSISVYATDTTDVVLDIDGYFVPANDAALAFFPLTPCRVVDTRDDNGPLGGPYLHDRQTRDFPVLASTCNIPAGAQAYSMNFTALPRYGASLGYLTAWPSGQQKPYVSTLNAPTGTVVANAAIVPAGQGGDINVYPYGADTDLIIDIDGYFAPANSGPDPLSLYSVIPCRTLDTRKSTEFFVGELTVGVVSGPCQVPGAAQAYVMTATVVPPFPLGYLTLWPDGQPQPEVSTLNAYDGAVTSNMAIVPTTNGSIDAYAFNQTQLILDISSYFAP